MHKNIQHLNCIDKILCMTKRFIIKFILYLKLSLEFIPKFSNCLGRSLLNYGLCSEPDFSLGFTNLECSPYPTRHIGPRNG